MLDVAANRRRDRVDAEPAPAEAAGAGARRRGRARRRWTCSCRPTRCSVGEQVDVITAAWFPRDLRVQLRRPPTLQPPVIDGGVELPAVDARRDRRHPEHPRAVVRPLHRPPGRVPARAGTVGIPRATLKYSTPVALQFFSQEERFALASRADTLQVRAIPTTGRPARFTGAIGSALTLERQVDPATARVGEGVAVEMGSRRGQHGPLAQAGAPWPATVRAYLERVDERVTTTRAGSAG